MYLKNTKNLMQYVKAGVIIQANLYRNLFTQHLKCLSRDKPQLDQLYTTPTQMLIQSRTWKTISTSFKYFLQYTELDFIFFNLP